MKRNVAFLLAAALMISAVPSIPGVSANPFLKQVHAEENSTFEAYSNTVAIGTKDAAIDDIIIREPKAGSFQSGMNIYLQVEDLKLGDSPQVVVDAGDIKVEKVTVVDGNTLKIAIKRSSSKEASAIRITNLTLYLSSDIPEGVYALRLVTEESDKYEDNVFGSNYGDKDEPGKFDTKSMVLVKDFVRAVLPSNLKYDDSIRAMKIDVENNEMSIGARKVELNPACYISEGRVMIPLRVVVENLEAMNGSGGSVMWDDASKTISIISSSKTVAMSYGKTDMTINGVQVPMSGKVEIKDGVSFLPLRDLGNALGATQVTWDDDTKTATIQ